MRSSLRRLRQEPPEGFFQVKKHSAQKYAKFLHKGATSKLETTYNLIYSSWITEIQLEFADNPILEFYVNHHEKIDKENFLTEIYIPIV